MGQRSRFLELNFFQTFARRTLSLFSGPLIPLFWTSGGVSPRFQNWGESLACNLYHYNGVLRFTSGATLAGLLEAKRAAKSF